VWYYSKESYSNFGLYPGFAIVGVHGKHLLFMSLRVKFVTDQWICLVRFMQIITVRLVCISVSLSECCNFRFFNVLRLCSLTGVLFVVTSRWVRRGYGAVIGIVSVSQIFVMFRARDQFLKTQWNAVYHLLTWHWKRVVKMSEDLSGLFVLLDNGEEQQLAVPPEVPSVDNTDKALQVSFCSISVQCLKFLLVLLSHALFCYRQYMSLPFS